MPEPQAPTDLSTLIDLTNHDKERAGPVANIVLYRHNPGTGQYRMCATLPADICSNEGYVQKRFGGGTYKFILKNQKHQILAALSNIELAAPDGEMKDELKREGITPEVPLPETAVAIRPSGSELEILRSELTENRLLMREMIQAFSTNQGGGGGSIGEIIKAFAMLQGMQPARPPAFDELMPRVFEKAFDLATKIQGGTAGNDSWFTLARDVMKEAIPLLKSAVPVQPAAVPPAAPAPVANNPVDNPPAVVEGEEDYDLTPAVNQVKTFLQSGLSPQTIVELTLNSAAGNPEFAEVIAGAIEIPLEEYFEMDPELQTLPLKTQFTQVIEGLRARILANRNTERAAGN